MKDKKPAEEPSKVKVVDDESDQEMKEDKKEKEKPVLKKKIIGGIKGKPLMGQKKAS